MNIEYEPPSGKAKRRKKGISFDFDLWFTLAAIEVVHALSLLLLAIRYNDFSYINEISLDRAATTFASVHYLLYLLWHAKLRQFFGLPKLNRETGWQFFEHHMYISCLIITALGIYGFYIVNIAQLTRLPAFFAGLVFYYSCAMIFYRWHKEEIPWSDN